MNGKRLLLDTNAIVSLLAGNMALADRLLKAEWVGISIMSRIEFLAFSGLSAEDKALFAEFLQRVDVLGLANDDSALLDNVVHIRQRYSLKIPDAIIAAQALCALAVLVTADKEFQKIAELSLVSP